MTAEEKFILENFKLDKLLPTELEASFIVRNGIDGHYSLYIYDKFDNELLEGPLQIKADSNRLQVISFKCNKKILPNTEYTLRIQATSAVGENVLTRSLSFTTPQDFPNSARSIRLSCADKIISTNSKFELSVEMPIKLGYWSKNKTGYEKVLIVNNKTIKTKTVNDLENINKEKFTIKDEFDYDIRTCDTIQIGIRIWVTDDEGKKVYDEIKPKTSDSICIINTSVQAYLTK
jgi:hypothetical protein